MRIGFDFDHVLFDTEKFKQHLFRSIDGFDSTYEDAVDENGVYRPKEHAAILDVSISEFRHAIKYADQCLYDDVSKLANLPDGMTPIIVSRGDQEFQSAKIQQSGVLKFVDEFLVVQSRAKDEATGIDFLVDDAAIEHERVSLPQDRRFLFDRSEHSLEDVIEKLKKLNMNTQ